VRLKVSNIIIISTVSFCISIPTGAIKRPLYLLKRPHKLLFQFLLVRLKDQLQNCVNTPKYISIPTGAIKRQIPGGDGSQGSGFQFLLVRLKAKMLQDARQYVEFQFLLVRLKVPKLITVTCRKVISIPTGAIKRLKWH
jgi:hypothetical protein